jgi:hypothetical protein
MQLQQQQQSLLPLSATVLIDVPSFIARLSRTVLLLPSVLYAPEALSGSLEALVAGTGALSTSVTQYQQQAAQRQRAAAVAANAAASAAAAAAATAGAGVRRGSLVGSAVQPAGRANVANGAGSTGVKALSLETGPASPRAGAGPPMSPLQQVLQGSGSPRRR